MARWNRHSNCYGYAAKKEKWLQPDVWHDIIDLLDNNPNWKLVTKEELVLGKEYVAYRFSQDGDDFHFMRRNALGFWRHKCGGYYVESISTKYVLNSKWAHRPDGIVYDSPLFLFEIM